MPVRTQITFIFILNAVIKLYSITIAVNVLYQSLHSMNFNSGFFPQISVIHMLLKYVSAPVCEGTVEQGSGTGQSVDTHTHYCTLKMSHLSPLFVLFTNLFYN